MNGHPKSSWPRSSDGARAEPAAPSPPDENPRRRAGVENLVVVADVGMLSRANLQALNEAGYGFIVDARQTKAPLDLEAHFFWRSSVCLRRTSPNTNSQ